VDEAFQVDHVEPTFIEGAVALLSQQVWCWGQDVLRPEGNWLIETGFDRIEPPTEHEHRHSHYSLDLPRKRCVVPCGFGVFYGDLRWGGVFLPRFEFKPTYTVVSKLRRPPWTASDIPTIPSPTDVQRSYCASLTLGLIDWIQSYEATIVERLGVEYRRSTLVKWDDGERLSTPAEEMASAWQSLARRVAANFDALQRNPSHE